MTKKQANSLAEVFRDRFAADVDSEAIGKGRFRFAVTSAKFNKMSPLRRQDKVWSIVDEVLPREAVLDISLILALSPRELIAAE